MGLVEVTAGQLGGRKKDAGVAREQMVCVRRTLIVGCGRMR